MDITQDKAADVGSTNATIRPAMTAEKRVDWMQTFGLREMGVFYALLILVVVLSITTAMLGRANYLSVLNVTNVLYQSSLIGFMAVAMTVVLISGNFDLSVASVAALSAAVFVGSANAMGLGGAFVMAMGTAIIAGVVNGSIVQFLGINAFIVTLGSLTAIRGLVLIYTDGASLTIKDPAVAEALRVFNPIASMWVLRWRCLPQRCCCLGSSSWSAMAGCVHPRLVLCCRVPRSWRSPLPPGSK